MTDKLQLRGVIPPILTPFTDGGERVDEQVLWTHVDWLIRKGVHGLMTCGTTGEFTLLSPAERRRVTEIVVEAAAGRVPVVAHVGATSTGETIALARHAVACGADAVSIVTPYYFQLPDEALVRHYCRVAEAVPDAWVYLYNIPQNTGNTIAPAVAGAIAARCPNVLGIKDSSGDLDALRGYSEIRAGAFQAICGSDGLVLRALRVGACASVSGNANVFPEVLVALFEAHWRGDAAGAAQQQQRLDQVRTLLNTGGRLSVLKRSLTLRGLRMSEVRPPLLEAPQEWLAEVERRLRAEHLLD